LFGFRMVAETGGAAPDRAITAAILPPALDTTRELQGNAVGRRL